MQVAVLGTGQVGNTLAMKLVEVGHDVRMGSRDAANENDRAWAAAAGERGGSGTFADAAGVAELVVNATAGATSLEALEQAGVPRDATTVMPVPGAFELPLAAMALAKTRRYACVVALGCIIRGETPHFDFVAGEAASGLQLAALETGVPVSFGVLTVETREQALARTDRGAEAAETALEMADVFTRVRSGAATPTR